LFVQSQVPEHTELAWILNTITPMAELKRMTQYKEKSEHFKENLNVGLFDYPVLQAADILLYQSDLVPVGKDQIQHIELARDLARKFNKKFGTIFLEPKPLLTAAPKIMSLKDPTKKMSKSLGSDHYLALSDNTNIIREKIKKAVTDAGSASDEISPGVKNLFSLLKIFSTAKNYRKFEQDLKNGDIKYSELKANLSEAISDYFSDFREKRDKLLKNKRVVFDILDNGNKKAKKIAGNNIDIIKKAVGLFS